LYINHIKSQTMGNPILMFYIKLHVVMTLFLFSSGDQNEHGSDVPCAVEDYEGI
jgi:hypothetical protein